MTDIERVPVGGAEQLARRHEILSSLADRGPTPRPISPLEQELAETRALYELCSMYVKAGDMLPRAFRPAPAERGRAEVTPEQAAARLAIVARTGRTFGWDVLTSVRMLDNIDGQPKLKTEALIALVRRAGHRIDIDDQGNRVTVTGRRADDGSTMTATWDEDRAKSVPHTLWENGQRRETTLWAKWVKAGQTAYMLRWRALSEVGRFLFSDVTLGLAGDWEDVPAEQPLGPPAAPRPALFERVQAKAAQLAPSEDHDGHTIDVGSVVVLTGQPESVTIVAEEEPTDELALPLDVPEDLVAAGKALGITVVRLAAEWGQVGVRNWADLTNRPEIHAEVWAWMQEVMGQ